MATAGQTTTSRRQGEGRDKKGEGKGTSQLYFKEVFLKLPYNTCNLLAQTESHDSTSLQRGWEMQFLLWEAVFLA